MIPSLALLGALSADPQIVVYTMGPGKDLFERFGHAAVCVESRERGRCYNYGTTDFQTPPEKIGWEFIRGNSRFWVAIWPRDRMLRAYISTDRDVFRQVLPLTPEQTRRVIARLEEDSREENRYYRYHHFDDNCTTRIRDVIDDATGGAFLKGADASAGVTRRELGAQGLAEWPLAIAAGQLFAGPRLDRDMTRNEAMFLPSNLRAELTSELGAKPERVNSRRGPPFPARPGPTWHYFMSLALGLTLPLVAVGRRGRFARVAVVLCGTILGALGVLVWGLSLLAHMQELRVNQALLLFWPTDLSLGFLGARARTSYARLRALAALCTLILSVIGVLRQPLVAPALLVLLPLGWLGWSTIGAVRAPFAKVRKHGLGSRREPDSVSVTEGKP
ncbi:MAG: DUF4105 domain-containing protein [Polyangiaceae bacterium]|nr:DUF4105 domain-containing protein [Myxococcales bacterium]MCB9587497.1 DUF4105 domain-containing protein [Polyangiaceae bacterium]MCB9605706.1 DUF4105 domain-containing protein [Polyangiaceae bacterium]